MPTYAELTSKQKAAAVVISVGTDIAAQIYKYLKDEEVEDLTYEIAGLQNLSSDDTDKIYEEFYGLCLTHKVITEGGTEYARAVLEKAFGVQTANQLLERVTKSLQAKAFDFIRKADYKHLMNMIQNEHPQTIALILSYARADQASAIISELPQESKIEVVERIARMDRTSPEITREVEHMLERKFTSISATDYAEIGGVDYIADIMNNMDRAVEKFIFEELNVKDAELSEEIRKKMFVFEDIAELDGMSIQRFLQEVDGKDLAVALKGANADLQSLIFANVSKRMAESVQSDMEYLTNVRMRDVGEAQQRIVTIIRRLEEEGEVVIMKGGKDDYVL